VLLGPGQIPASLNAADRLPDVHGLKGPLAGILSAFRWAPESAWLISSAEAPFMGREAWDWLLSQRKPGIWAILPKLPGSDAAGMTTSLYEPMIFEYVESLARRGAADLSVLAAHQKVITPLMPESIK